MHRTIYERLCVCLSELMIRSVLSCRWYRVVRESSGDAVGLDGARGWQASEAEVHSSVGTSLESGIANWVRIRWFAFKSRTKDHRIGNGTLAEYHLSQLRPQRRQTPRQQNHIHWRRRMRVKRRTPSTRRTPVRLHRPRMSPGTWTSFALSTVLLNCNSNSKLPTVVEVK